ncbi:hypothetical protein EUGRSUZ_D00341 [Eucalyptus grandis]|uniref:Uncharacterized protein n=2 Tax=Eucalyptus grandis TaxID=71139 RepID=A0ACC3L2G8_EUCGR|nr:hypothetical protein EUGRSUZ_D00341 [Eucalyptus grandis]
MEDCSLLCSHFAVQISLTNYACWTPVRLFFLSSHDFLPLCTRKKSESRSISRPLHFGRVLTLFYAHKLFSRQVIYPMSARYLSSRCIFMSL